MKSFMNLNPTCHSICYQVISQAVESIRASSSENVYFCSVLICCLCCQRHSTEAELYVCGTRVYECHLCERGFTKQDFLTRHIDRMHNRPHPCRQCDQRFSTKEDLQLHKPIHNLQNCPYCRQVFPLRDELLKHVPHAHEDYDLSESNGKCWPEFAYREHVRDGNAKIGYRYLKDSLFDPFC